MVFAYLTRLIFITPKLIFHVKFHSWTWFLKNQVVLHQHHSSDSESSIKKVIKFPLNDLFSIEPSCLWLMVLWSLRHQKLSWFFKLIMILCWTMNFYKRLQRWRLDPFPVWTPRVWRCIHFQRSLQIYIYTHIQISIQLKKDENKTTKPHIKCINAFSIPLQKNKLHEFSLSPPFLISTHPCLYLLLSLHRNPI